MSVIKMSKKEAWRIEAISRAAKGDWSYRRASQEARLSKRQLIRLVKRFKEGGPEEVTHRSRGKKSPKMFEASVRENASRLINHYYEDFGPTLATEQLDKRHGLKFSREWVRKLMIEKGLWSSKKQQALRLHQRRERRPREGELIQIDGSYADWFEGRAPKCCLLVAIDDATGKLQELRFVDHETREDYFALMKSYIEKRGKPLAIYADRHSIFKTTRKYDVYEDTQFERAMKELEIELIHANSPQAKGRVERANGTLQDRLIKLMRLEGISSKEEGNGYLESYIEEHNNKFAKMAKDPEDAHRQLSQKKPLDKVLCIKEMRRLSKQLTVQFERRCYQLQPKCGSVRRLIGAMVLLYQTGDGVIIEREGKECEYTVYEEPPTEERVMDRKAITAFLDKKTHLTKIQRLRRKIAANF